MTEFSISECLTPLLIILPCPDASTAVPRAMINKYVISLCLIFPAVSTLCFAVTDV